MSRSKSLADAWQKYDREVLPEVAGEVQRSESRKAFYAGAVTLFGLMTSGFDDGEEMTAADEARMMAIRDEIEAFLADVARMTSEAIARRSRR
jgi:hypothetical protein